MGRGTSKAGGGSARGAGGGGVASKVVNNEFANEIYSINRTMAFPSTKSVIERVPELKAMKNALDNASEGAMVSFHLGNTGMEDTVVYEKTGKRQWTVTRLKKQADGTVEQYGGESKLQGTELLKSFADKHYRGFDNKEGFTKEYDLAYSEIKKKRK